jgi:PBP1b-binding outer membrane lipoprotein LpoB
MNTMIKVFLLLVFLFSGCEDQKNGQNEVVKNTNESTMQKHKHPLGDDEPAICENLSVAECLTIIIPAIWDREVERDCS